MFTDTLAQQHFSWYKLFLSCKEAKSLCPTTINSAHAECPTTGAHTAPFSASPQALPAPHRGTARAQPKKGGFKEGQKFSLIWRPTKQAGLMVLMITKALHSTAINPHNAPGQQAITAISVL